MLILDKMESCYGCGACFNACPTGAIDMKENAEGFLEPVVDEGKCISCGKCRQVCPAVNCQYSNKTEPDIFAFSAEEKILYDSSSGGIFTFLAEHVLRIGGYVVGAAYDSEFYVNHAIIHSMDELDKIRRSKYLQSSTGTTFQKTKEILEGGHYVLYSGCPCQIAGLLRFLGKDYDRLYTVDLLCHGVPSPGLFQEHIKNSFGGVGNVDDIEFRSREGWISLFKVTLKNKDVRMSQRKNVYMQSFLQDINLRASCFQCQYSRLPRQGDITIGDLWAAGNLNLPFEYRKGVSVVLINNGKGKELFQDSLSGTTHKFHVHKLYNEDMEAPCNIKQLNENIFHPSACNSSVARRHKFFRDCTDIGFESAVHQALHKFDVGLMLFMSNNYGSIATNYALYRAINDMGKKAAVLDHLVFIGNDALKFAREHMNLCSDFMERNDCQAADQCFETFVVGSDMTWNWRLNQFDRLLRFMMLGFVSENKRMISYAPSFGANKGEKDIEENAKELYSYYLKRFDAISVREDYGVDMCRNLFGIKAEQVLDPVLLCDREIWNELSATSQIRFEEEYLLAYILDSTPDKRQVILEAAKKLNRKLVVILDLESDFAANKRAMNMDDKIVRPGFTDWLAYFRHASYVITDSFHGACFSIIFGKKFVAIKNRSKERFDSLAKLINCPFLFFDDSRLLLGKTEIFADIDYDFVYGLIEVKQKESENWLHSALKTEIKPKSSNSSTKLMLQLFGSLHEKTEILNKMRREYAYEEKEKKENIAELGAGKTWMDLVSLRNNRVSESVELRKIDSLQEYFSMIKAGSKYVVVLSCRDECANYRQRFLDVSGLPLRTDVAWRDSYVAVIDEGLIKIDEKSKEEININYEFVIGHPSYNVEYLNGQLKVCCVPLRYCGIRVKSKGFSHPVGADKSEIFVDNIDYSMNKTGINIVVIDKETGRVIDSINVNTYSDAGLRINRI